MDLESLSRKELQALAKEHGIKANLSNAAIIEALQKQIIKEDKPVVEEVVQTSLITEAVEEIVVDVEQPLSFTYVEELPIVSVIDTTATAALPSEPKSFAAGCEVEAFLFGVWIRGSIKKLNKKTVRVSLVDGKEATVKMDEIRHINGAPAEQPVEIEQEEQVVETIAEQEAAKSAAADLQTIDEEAAPAVNELPAEPIEVPAELGNVDAAELMEELMIEDEDNETLRMLEAFEPAVEYARISEAFPSPSKALPTTSPHTVRFRASLPKNMGSTKKIQQQKAATPKKTFATSPLKAVPSIQPKSNAAQRLRLEALHTKRNQETLAAKKIMRQSTLNTIRKTPSNTPSLTKTPSIPANPPAPSEPISRVRFDAPSPSRPSATSGVVNRKSTPNFKKMHNKQFANSKSITALVERKTSIVKKMDDAFHSAMDEKEKEKENRVEKSVPSFNVGQPQKVSTKRSSSANLVTMRKKTVEQKTEAKREETRAKRLGEGKEKRSENLLNKRTEGRKSEPIIECY